MTIRHLLNAIQGPSSVDTGALLGAWQQTIIRHAILRAVFIRDLASGAIFQRVLKEHKADITVLKVSSVEEATIGAGLHLDTVRSNLFKDDSPPVSVRLLVSSYGEIFVHFVMGHILIDHSPGAKPLTGFHDCIEHINSQRDVHASSEYWVDKLQGVKPYMVPIETMVRSGPDPHIMGSINFVGDITVEMKQFLCEVGVTLSNVLQFAWAMLLHVYTACASFDDSTMIIQALQAFQDENIRSLNHKTFDLTEVERQLGCEGTGLFNTLVNHRKVKYSDDDIEIGFRSIWKQDPHEASQKPCS
ncbi:peptide synthetase [Colletotrichum cuscutae]|uniref:Peptide synthetase n=1 Tax=Colletotrichum cuscutae TaxID=1209917 RepID=A0AAI9V6F7_9PEZI|nr:peptide synthetase [Colletotrichum cuscutae]